MSNDWDEVIKALRDGAEELESQGKDAVMEFTFKGPYGLSSTVDLSREQALRLIDALRKLRSNGQIS